MNTSRPNLGFGSELDDFEPTTWANSKPINASPKSERQATRQIAESVGFKSREPITATGGEAADIAYKIERRRRTGRNAQFNLKARPETIEAFCKIADKNGWGLGETLEYAVIALSKEP